MMRLHFQTYGTGFPVIILHGLLGSLDNWQLIARKLGESLQIFTVDLRNYGRSPHEDVFDYLSMAEDLAEFMNTHQLSRAHIIGHSLGGKVAMHFALHHSTLVEKLIVIDMSPRACEPSHLSLLDALLSVDLSKFRERAEVGDALVEAVPEIEMRQFLVKNLGRAENGSLYWKPNLAVIRREYHKIITAIKPGPTFSKPVLFIKGAYSDYLDESDASFINQLFPCTNIKTIAEAGHWVHADAPEVLTDILRRFLLINLSATPSTSI